MKYIKTYTTTITLLALAFLFSCKKSEVENLNELYVYTAGGNEASNISTANFVTLRTSFLPVAGSGIPVLITRPYDKDVTITAHIDTTLIHTYDSLNKVTSPILPLDALALRNNGRVTIKAGTTVSSDSLFIDLNSIDKFDRSKTYIVPLSLISAESGVPVSNRRQTMYVKLSFINVAGSIVSFTNESIIQDKIVKTLVSTLGPSHLYFTATVNQAIPSGDAVFTISENSSLIESFNLANKTNYKPFPAGSYKLVKNKVTVPAGSTSAKDSFTVELTDLSKFEMGNTYLLPFTANDESIASLDSTKKNFFIVLTTETSNIDMDNMTVPKNFISRTNPKWEVSAVSNQTFGPGIDMLDGDYATSWMSSMSQNKASITIDMQQSNSLNGLQVVANYLYGGSYNAYEIEVQTSADNVAFTSEGTYTIQGGFGGSTRNPDKRNIHFYAPVQARYFKLILKSSKGWAGLSEVQAF